MGAIHCTSRSIRRVLSSVRKKNEYKCVAHADLSTELHATKLEDTAGRDDSLQWPLCAFIGGERVKSEFTGSEANVRQEVELPVLSSPCFGSSPSSIAVGFFLCNQPWQSSVSSSLLFGMGQKSSTQAQTSTTPTINIDMPGEHTLGHNQKFALQNGVGAGVVRTKILLLGMRRSATHDSAGFQSLNRQNSIWRAGKTSILNVLFNRLPPKQTFYLETTIRITKHVFEYVHHVSVLWNPYRHIHQYSYPSWDMGLSGKYYRWRPGRPSVRFLFSNFCHRYTGRLSMCLRRLETANLLSIGSLPTTDI